MERVTSTWEPDTADTETPSKEVVIKKDASKSSFSRNRRQKWQAKLESYLSSHAIVILFLLFYAAVIVLMFMWGAREEYMHTQKPKMRWIIAVARGFGYVLNLNVALVILLACRLTLTAIRETPLNMFIPFDKSFPAFHIIVAYVIVVAASLHGIFHLTWISIWSGWRGGLWGINMCVGTGIALFVILFAMAASSTPFVRRERFGTFWLLHNICAFLFFALLLIHGVYIQVPYTYKWITAPLVIYIVDRSMRRFNVKSSALHLSGEDSVLKGADILRLQVPRLFHFRAGQYAGKSNKLSIG